MNHRASLAAVLIAGASTGVACAPADGDTDTLEVSSALSSTLTIKGNLAIPDPYDCTGGTTSSGMSWADCHAFKRHFDPTTGASITSAQYVAGALRPLNATVIVVYQSSTGAFCDTQSTQTDENGKFSVKVKNCATDLNGIVNLGVVLQYGVKNPSDSTQTLGTLRALWDRAGIPQPYGAGPENVVFTDVNGSWITAESAVQNVFFTLAAHSSTEDLGTRIVDGRDFPATHQSFVRGALAAWQNLVSLQFRTRAALKQSGVASPYASYATLFPVVPYEACTNCYSLNFALKGGIGSGVGGLGGFVMGAPAPNITEAQVMSLSAAGLVAHELGHSINASLAPSTMQSDDAFSSGAMNPDGTTYFNPHSLQLPASATALQEQDMALAMVEGFGDAMARFLLLDGCNGTSPTTSLLGDPSMLETMWDLASYDFCDAHLGSGCPTHNFRFQMSRRGVSEGSPEWNRRRAALIALAQTAATGGMKYVLSNNEAKAQAFYCRLLATHPDYASMAGQIKGQRYVDDYLFLVSEIVDGRSPAPTWRSYASDVSTSKPHLSLLHLLTSMSALCPGCESPSVLPTPMWKLPKLIDGGNAAYDRAWISTGGFFSPQALSATITRGGWATKSQMNTALRATYMEEVP